MRLYPAIFVLCLCATLCHAQASATDQPSLTQMRDKYDAPFNRNLQSFDCAVDFSWKQHFTETWRVGDEGTDEELQNIFQPIRNRVTVAKDKVTAYANLTEAEIDKLPHGGMAEGLLEHAIEKSLYTWLPGGTNTILPASGSPVAVKQSPAGYRLTYTQQGAAIEMALTTDMRLQSATLRGPQSERIDTTFAPGPQGFVLTSFAMAENGDTRPGNRLIFTYTYQTVDGVQLPQQVVINRESHHEIWRYSLSGCSVKASN